MISDDERKEVVENLRHLSYGNRVRCKEEFFELLDETVMEPGTGYHEMNDVFERLADLIEPPTCTVRMGVTGHVGVCMRCGAMVEMSTAVFDAIEALPTRYCPNCGAEVVG